MGKLRFKLVSLGLCIGIVLRFRFILYHLYWMKRTLKIIQIDYKKRRLDFLFYFENTFK